MSDSDPHLSALVSTKGVLRNHNRVLLVKNARSEWELPGGKLHVGESLEECLRREILEELGLVVGASKVLDVFHHHYYENIVVIAYDCGEIGDADFSLGSEHSDGGWFELMQILKMNVPENYKRVIQGVYAADGSPVDA
jgi:8-oxo-dGTP diphosphatase